MRRALCKGMRFFLALGVVAALLSPLACAPAPSEQQGELRADLSASCSASREDILASTSAARGDAITRGFSWLDANVPYSQSKYYGGYRTDCSGFVSMCWDLGTSTNTATLFATGSYDSDLASWDDLLPADAIVRQGHVVMFLAWEPDKTGVCVLEQASTASDMQFRVHSLSSLQSQGFKPIRASKLADDTGAATGATGSDPSAAASATGSDSSDPTTTPTRTPAPASCVSPADVDVCNEAKLTRGIACGSVVDACGNTVSCDGVPGFGCGPSGTCNAAQQCSGSTCQPGAAVDLCGHEKAARGVQCGVISNGCGGTLSCDTVPGFGCAKGQKCGATHRCEKAGSTGATAAPAIPETPPASGAVPPAGDDGETTPLGGSDSSASNGSKGASDPKATSTSLPSAKTPSASSGCSVSSTNAGGGSRDMLPLLGVALALSIGRRRRSGCLDEVSAHQSTRFSSR